MNNILIPTAMSMSMSMLLLSACASTSTTGPANDPPTETLASLCNSYYSSVSKLTTEQKAKVDQTTAQKVDANCSGSGSFGPKPRGNQMTQVRDATIKITKLAQG